MERFIDCQTQSSLGKIVISRGNPRARLMIIGEAPGASEDAAGEPFVGRSGKVLNQLLENTGLNTREDAYICNVVKSRPPKNRRPTKDEREACMPWLLQQITLNDPWVIALAGSTAVEAILGIKGGISGIRGTWQNWHGKMVMPLFHPSYLLRNPSLSNGSPVSLTRRDLLEVKKKLESFNKVDHSLIPNFSA